MFFSTGVSSCLPLAKNRSPEGREAAGRAAAGGGVRKELRGGFRGGGFRERIGPRGLGAAAVHALCSPVEGSPAARRQQVPRCDREQRRGGSTVSALCLPWGGGVAAEPWGPPQAWRRPPLVPAAVSSDQLGRPLPWGSAALGWPAGMCHSGRVSLTQASADRRGCCNPPGAAESAVLALWGPALWGWLQGRTPSLHAPLFGGWL